MAHQPHVQSDQNNVSQSMSRPSLVLSPATHTTVVTTTTTTTVSYAPITLPPIPRSPTVVDSKEYPLLNVPLPRSIRRIPLVFPNGTRAIFQDPATSEEELDAAWLNDDVIGGEGWQHVKPSTSGGKGKERLVNLPDALDRFAIRKRVHSDSDPIGDGHETHDVVMESAEEFARSPPPRKKARPADVSSSTRSNAGPPSPLPSPPPTGASPVLWSAHGPNHGPASSHSPPQPPIQPDLSLTTLLALPDLISHFVSLPPGLQTHTLLSLMRHSPLPVLRTVHSVLGPTLARDFVAHLPPELASYILQLLPPAALFSAARVSKSWRRLVDQDATVWISLMKRTGTWFGGRSEEMFVHLVEEYRSRHPPRPERDGRELLALPHPYKLLFKSRRTVLSRWQQTTPKRVHFAAHGSAVVTCLLFSRRRIISASDDHSIHMYDPTDGTQLRKLEGHNGGVWALAVCSRRLRDPNPDAPPRYYDTLVSGSTDRTVRIWDLATGRNTHVFGGHTSTVRCLAIVRPTWIDVEDGTTVRKERWPKRTVIVTGSRDHSLRVWRLPGRNDDEYRCFAADTDEDPGELPQENTEDNPFHLRLLSGHGHAVRALAAHGRTLVSGSYDATVRVWDIVSGDCKFVLSGHSQKVYSVVMDPVRKQVCSGSMDGSVRIWSLQTGQCLHTLMGHTSLVGLLSLSPSTLVSAAADSTLRIWNPETGGLHHTLSAHTGAITCFQHDDFKVLSGSDGALKMWDARDGTVVRDLLTNITGVWQVVFDERYCIAASNVQDNTFLDVWDFGAEGEDDIEAAKIAEDDEESESEDEDEEWVDDDVHMSMDEMEDAPFMDATQTMLESMHHDNPEAIEEHQRQVWALMTTSAGQTGSSFSSTVSQPTTISSPYTPNPASSTPTPNPGNTTTWPAAPSSFSFTSAAGPTSTGSTPASASTASHFTTPNGGEPSSNAVNLLRQQGPIVRRGSGPETSLPKGKIPPPLPFVIDSKPELLEALVENPPSAATSFPVVKSPWANPGAQTMPGGSSGSRPGGSSGLNRPTYRNKTKKSSSLRVGGSSVGGG